MNHDLYPDETIGDILRNVSLIAMVGASPNPTRPSHHVFEFLQHHGYDVVPVNPGQVGKDLFGRAFVASLGDIDHPVDMIEIFRASAQIMPVVEEILAMKRLPSVIWMQLGVRNDTAAAKAEAAGIQVVMNRCPAIEIPRLCLPPRRP